MVQKHACTLRRSEKELLERTEMRMLRWILSDTLKDEKRNNDTRHAIGIAYVEDKICEARMR